MSPFYGGFSGSYPPGGQAGMNPRQPGPTGGLPHPGSLPPTKHYEAHIREYPAPRGQPKIGWYITDGSTIVYTGQTRYSTVFGAEAAGMEAIQQHALTGVWRG